MAVLAADFELGTNGNTVATGDTGSADQWDVVSAANLFPKYSTAQAAHGTKSMVITNPGALCRALWSTKWGTKTTTTFGRCYFYIATGFAGTSSIVRWTAGTPAIQMDSSRRILAVGPSTVTSAALSLATWYRFEWKVVPSVTVGLLEVKIFALDSTTVIETLTTTTGNNGANTTTATFGNIAGTTGSIFFDNIVDGCTAYPGPFPAIVVAPTVSGSAPVGSTLTATTGTWNGTFTYTYQWTRNGSPIGGATSSTYVTDAADAGTAVGATVTATGQNATLENASSASSNTISVSGGAYQPGFRFGF